MNKRSFWAATLVLSVALFAGCSQSSETSETAAGDAAHVSDAVVPSDAAHPAGGSSSTPKPTPIAPPAPRRITVPAGTDLRVRTTNTLSTKTVQTGESFTGSLEEPLMVGNTLIAAKGATVYGKVVNADPGGRVKGTALLVLRLNELAAANGERIAISTNTYAVEAKSSKKEDAKKVAIGAGIGAAIGAIAGGGSGAAKGAGVGAGAGTGVVLGTRGEPAVIPSESVVTFSITDSFSVKK